MYWATLVIAVCTAGFIGWFFRDIWEKIQILIEKVNRSNTKDQKEKGKPTMAFSEPMTPLEYAALEEKQRIERMNQ